MYRFDTIFVIGTPGEPETPSLMINTWHYEPVAAPGTNYDNVRDILQDFYQELITGGVMSLSYVVGTNIRAYNLEDPEPRTPLYESDMTFTGGDTAPMPSEVSIVFTFEAARESGTLRRRRRNRKYLAPIAAATISDDGRIGTTEREIIATAGSNMKAAAAASVNWEWQVYSTTDDTGYAVEDGYIDDSFDTQRRRGFAPTVRSTWD